MAVAYMMEWDNPKDEERFRKYMKLGKEMSSHIEEMQKKGLCKFSNWIDDTEHVISWLEFKDIDDFGKMWTDKEYSNLMAKWRPNVDNLRVRLLRRAGSGITRFET
jgi:hypothetical protein